LSKSEALTVKNQIKKQAMIIFMTGLPHNSYYIVLMARNLTWLEDCIKISLEEELEYNSKINIKKLQENVENPNFNNEQQGGSGDEAKKTNR